MRGLARHWYQWLRTAFMSSPAPSFLSNFLEQNVNNGMSNAGGR